MSLEQIFWTWLPIKIEKLTNRFGFEQITKTIEKIKAGLSLQFILLEITKNLYVYRYRDELKTVSK